MTEQEKFLRALSQGQSLRRVQGVYGRILRTTKDKPTMLSEDEQRKVVMVMGPCGLQQMLGLHGYDLLIKIGYSPRYIAGRLARGIKFKLAVFERPPTVRTATWRVAMQVVSRHYPELEAAITRALPELMNTPVAYFERQAGFDFAEVQANGSKDPRFMTSERLLNSKQAACEVRQFLFHVLNFSELFAGDGYTLTHDCRRGVREYVMPNCQLRSLANCHILDLDIQLPEAQL